MSLRLSCTAATAKYNDVHIGEPAAVCLTCHCCRHQLQQFHGAAAAAATITRYDSPAMALASQLLQASLVTAAAINNDDLVWLRLQLLQLLQCRHDATSLI
jgi:hypothetical protein